MKKGRCFISVLKKIIARCEEMDNIERWLENNLDLLGKEQLSNGGFVSYSSSDRAKFNRKYKYQTNFHPALILNALAEIDSRQSVLIKNKIKKYLMTQKNPGWSFNYWQKDTPENKTHRVPDDLDDTFLALAGLYRFDQGLFSPQDWAMITGLLLRCEKKEGGPYRTWLVGKDFPKKWLDVDLAVNANIGYFLFLSDIELPGLNKFLDRCIEKNGLNSLYYPDELMVIYYLSRFYKGKARNILMEKVLAELNGVDNKNALECGLVLNAAINIGLELSLLKKCVERVMVEVESNKQLVALICIDPAIKGVIHYSGAEATTRAICLEGVAKYQQNLNKKKVVQRKVVSNILADNSDRIFYQQVVEVAQSEIGNLPKNLAGRSRSFLARMIAKDEDGEIVLLPKVVADSMNIKLDSKILQKLCLGSLYGWVSYTLYDNFLDDEFEHWMLPVANIYFQKLSEIYLNFRDTRIKEIFTNAIERMEEANIREADSCRFEIKNKLKLIDLPDYGEMNILAEKSIGHALGPLSVMMFANADNQDLENMDRFFRFYLMARQLNDDAHDWSEDLKRGQINAAGAMVLRNWFREKTTFNMKTDLSRLELMFWEEVIDDVTAKIVEFVGEANQAVNRIKIINKKDYYRRRLLKLKEAARRATKGAADTKEFIQTINGI